MLHTTSPLATCVYAMGNKPPSHMHAAGSKPPNHMRTHGQFPQQQPNSKEKMKKEKKKEKKLKKKRKKDKRRVRKRKEEIAIIHCHKFQSNKDCLSWLKRFGLSISKVARIPFSLTNWLLQCETPVIQPQVGTAWKT